MLVANPAASQFTGGDHRRILQMLGRSHLIESVWPHSAADARTIAADAVTAGFDGVVAMGGDGIVHQVAQSLVGTDVFLAVLPAGTTNVFARQAGLPYRAVRAARLLTDEVPVRPWPVVTVEANLDDGSVVTRHAVFAAGLGFDADIVAAAETEPYRKYRFGGIHYARTALAVYWSDLRKRRPTLTIEDPFRSVRGIGVMAQFHSTFTYFGPFALRFSPKPPHPMAVLTIERLPLRRLPSLLWNVARATPARVRGVAVWEDCERFSVEAEEPALMELDGELIGRVTAAAFEYRSDALWVAAPASGDSAPA